MHAHVIAFPQARRVGWIRKHAQRWAGMDPDDSDRELDHVIRRTQSALLRAGIAPDVAAHEADKLRRALNQKTIDAFTESLRRCRRG